MTTVKRYLVVDGRAFFLLIGTNKKALSAAWGLPEKSREKSYLKCGWLE